MYLSSKEGTNSAKEKDADLALDEELQTLKSKSGDWSYTVSLSSTLNNRPAYLLVISSFSCRERLIASQDLLQEAVDLQGTATYCFHSQNYSCLA